MEFDAGSNFGDDSGGFVDPAFSLDVNLSFSSCSLVDPVSASFGAGERLPGDIENPHDYSFGDSLLDIDLCRLDYALGCLL